MMKGTEKAVGIMKTKITVRCSVCNQKHTRRLSAPVASNTEESKSEAIRTLKERASKPYTCRICKIILKDQEQ